MASRLLSDLHPKLYPLCVRFLADCADEGIDVLIVCTHRSLAEQAELYAIGRTKPGKIVTRARPGESKHNFMLKGKRASLAFDCVPLRHGKLIWGTTGNGLDSDPSDDETDDLELWQSLGIIGRKLGLGWAGDWKKGFREYPHFEIEVPE